MSALLNFVRTSKVCSNCKENKPFSEFSKNKASSDGLQYKCRPCDLIYQTKRTRKPSKKFRLCKVLSKKSKKRF